MLPNKETQAVSGTRRILRSGSYLGLANLYNFIVRSVYVVVFARVLGIEQYGAYVYAQSWYLVAIAIASWGTGELAMAERARLGPDRGNSILGSGLTLRLCLSLAATLAVSACAVLFEAQPHLQLLILIYAHAALTRGLANYFAFLFITHENSRVWCYISVIFQTVEIVLAISLALSGTGLVAIAIVQCAVWWALLLTCWTIHNRLHPSLELGGTWRHWPALLRNGAALGLATLVFSSLGYGLLIFYRYFIVSPRQLGEAAFAIQLVLMLGQAIKVISNAAITPLSEPGTARHRRQGLFFTTVWSQSLLLGGAFYFTCNMLMPPVVSLVVGPEFRDSADLLARFSWLLIPLPIIFGIRVMLISINRVRGFLLAMLVGLLVVLIQMAGLTLQSAVNLDSVLAALGSGYLAITSVGLAQLWRSPVSLSIGEMLYPLALFAGCAAFYLLLHDSGPVMVPAACLVSLLLASALQLRSLRNR